MNQAYQHRHLSGVTCEIINATRNGFKVRQFEVNRRGKIKEKITYYEAIYFHHEKGVWTRI